MKNNKRFLFQLYMTLLRQLLIFSNKFFSLVEIMERKDTFTCKNSNEFLLDMKCNFEYNCLDGEDEHIFSCEEFESIENKKRLKAENIKRRI